MTSGDSVQKIKDRLSIIDVVSPYVELHQAGKHFKGKSPFVNEKTPSFFVSPDRGMYYCFSSSQGGDMFTFVQSMEGVDFKEALKILAEKAGVELVKEDPKKRSERDKGYEMLELAASFFEEKRSGNKDAEKYIKERGVTKEIVEKWRIGYAPGPPNGGWRELRSYLKDKKFSDKQMQNVGLVKGGVEGKEPYDVFRDRIMFPIFDSSGKTVAFSGRILNKESEAPKYVNSPETEFFNKSEILYGYNIAKHGIRNFDFSLIVEGQFDVVLCHQAGYSNTVAVSGTSLTPHHVGLLQRLSNRVVLALDADRAGIEAVKRAADLMLVRGMDVKVAMIKDGSDPADIIKEDKDQFKKTIGEAKHVIEFLLYVLKNESKDERTYKLKVRDEILPYIIKMQNKIDAEHFEGVVADAIGTKKDSVHLEVLRIEEEQNEKKNIGHNQMPREINDKKGDILFSRKDDVLEYLVVASELLEEDSKKILMECIEEITGTKINSLIGNVKPERKSELIFKLEANFEDTKTKNVLEDLSYMFNELRLLILREAIGESKQLLYEAERSGDSEKVKKLLEETTILQKKLAQASKPKNIFENDNNEG